MSLTIDSLYRERYGDERIHQGDLFENIEIPFINISTQKLDFLNAPYAFVLTQDCDLESDFWKRTNIIPEKMCPDTKIYGNNFIPSILITIGFNAEEVRLGEHLSSLGLKMENMGPEDKTPWKKVVANENKRYHYFGKNDELDIPDLVIDFKRYYSLPVDFLYSKFKECYITSLSELVREDLSHRFFNFQARIGLPVFAKKK